MFGFPVECYDKNVFLGLVSQLHSLVSLSNQLPEYQNPDQHKNQQVLRLKMSTVSKLYFTALKRFDNQDLDQI